MPKNLSGYVCVVTGASRGLGRGIAIGLGKAGAVVYITGRTFDTDPSKDRDTGCLQETARVIESLGGKAIPMPLDHADDSQVSGLFNRIRREQSGRLDILVNCAFSATEHLLHEDQSTAAYWEPIKSDLSPGEEWDFINRVGLRNTYICCVLATQMMIKCRQPDFEIHQTLSNHSNDTTTMTTNLLNGNQLPTGLIVNISSIGGTLRVFNVPFCAGKSGIDRMSLEMSRDLRKHRANVICLSLIPEFVQTETTISAYESGKPWTLCGYTVNPALAMPADLLGDILAQLALQPKYKLIKRSGRCILAPDLAREFRIKRADGRVPPTLRSLKTILQLTGWRRMAFFCPSFVRLPYWLINLLTSKF